MALSPGSLRATLGWAGHGWGAAWGSEGRNGPLCSSHNIPFKTTLTTWVFHAVLSPFLAVVSNQM